MIPFIIFIFCFVFVLYWIPFYNFFNLLFSLTTPISSRFHSAFFSNSVFSFLFPQYFYSHNLHFPCHFLCFIRPPLLDFISSCSRHSYWPPTFLLYPYCSFLATGFFDVQFWLLALVIFPKLFLVYFEALSNVLLVKIKPFLLLP